MQRRTAVALVCLWLSSLAPWSSALAKEEPGLGTIRLDQWLYFRQNTDDSQRLEYRLRGLIPYNFASGWTFTQRIDVPFYYTDEPGPANRDDRWRVDRADAFVEEILDTPEVAKNLRLRLSARLLFPTGRDSPFGNGVWQLAPGFGATYRMPQLLGGVTLSPYVRYFFSYAKRIDDASEVRRLELFPAATFKLAGRWELELYPENAVSYNDVSHKWFVPIDFLFTNRHTKSFEYGLGAAYALVKDDPRYDWMVYGRLSWRF